MRNVQPQVLPTRIAHACTNTSELGRAKSIENRLMYRRKLRVCLSNRQRDDEGIDTILSVRRTVMTKGSYGTYLQALLRDVNDHIL